MVSNCSGKVRAEEYLTQSLPSRKDPLKRGLEDMEIAVTSLTPECGKNQSSSGWPDGTVKHQGRSWRKACNLEVMGREDSVMVSPLRTAPPRQGRKSRLSDEKWVVRDCGGLNADVELDMAIAEAER